MSVWIGTVADEAALNDFIEEHYDLDGNATCPLWAALGINWFDHDFQEIHWQQEPVAVLRLLDGSSWGASFAPLVASACSGIGIRAANSALILYDFAYRGSSGSLPGGLAFAGCFHYSGDAA
ncbi:MAG: immunity 22 family protein [Planctomycetes bacterium]|nr:immunity 22 family protein [Planctomycetota bacterium]